MEQIDYIDKLYRINNEDLSKFGAHYENKHTYRKYNPKRASS